MFLLHYLVIFVHKNILKYCKILIVFLTSMKLNIFVKKPTKVRSVLVPSAGCSKYFWTCKNRKNFLSFFFIFLFFFLILFICLSSFLFFIFLSSYFCLFVFLLSCFFLLIFYLSFFLLTFVYLSFFFRVSFF